MEVKRSKLQNLKLKWLWIRELLRINYKTILEYRAALMIQAVGMFINDIGFIVVWFMFFDIFKSVNGWGFKEMIALNGFVSIVFGIVLSFTYGIRRISRYVTFGQFDRFLVLPKSPLLSAIFTETHPSAIGDFIFGLICVAIYFATTSFDLNRLLLVVIMIIFGSIAFAGFTIVAQSVVFWIPNSEELSDTLFEFVLGPSLRPTSSYTGVFKLLFMTVFPAMLIGGFQIDILLSMDLRGVLYLLSAAIIWLFLAQKIFYAGLRRYESGSLVGSV